VALMRLFQRELDMTRTRRSVDTMVSMWIYNEAASRTVVMAAASELGRVASWKSGEQH